MRKRDRKIQKLYAWKEKKLEQSCTERHRIERQKDRRTERHRDWMRLRGRKTRAIWDEERQKDGRTEEQTDREIGCL